MQVVHEESVWQWLKRREWSTLARKACVFVVNFSLLVAGLFNLALGCLKASAGQEAQAVTYLIAGLLLLLAASIDRFELLKGFGLEAKTRELKEVLHEADATLDSLRDLALTTGGSIIQLQSSAGRWADVPMVSESHKRAQDVRAILSRVGVDDARVRAVLLPWVRMTLHEGSRRLVQAMRDALHQVQAANVAEAMAIPAPHTPDDAVRYKLLIAKGNAASDFNRDRIGNPWLWPAGTHSAKLLELVRVMPVIDESVRIVLLAKIEPWLPRLQHLESKQDLLEPEAWYALDPNS